MENKCLKCGNEVIVVNNGREIINKCTSCDYEVVTTYNSPMDLDNIKYVISILGENETSLKNIKLISKLTGFNYVQSKSYLQNGYSFKKEYAESILEKKKIFDEYGIKYNITPNFPY